VPGQTVVDGDAEVPAAARVLFEAERKSIEASLPSRAAAFGRQAFADASMAHAAHGGLLKAVGDNGVNFLAPCEPIKEATTDVKIFVITRWQDGPFVSCKPLCENDHSRGWGRWSA
jgi:hypothetical protein